MADPIPGNKKALPKIKPSWDKATENARKGVPAMEDPTRNPDGIYSGMTRRVAYQDGKHAEVNGLED